MAIRKRVTQNEKLIKEKWKQLREGDEIYVPEAKKPELIFEHGDLGIRIMSKDLTFENLTFKFGDKTYYNFDDLTKGHKEMVFAFAMYHRKRQKHDNSLLLAEALINLCKGCYQYGLWKDKHDLKPRKRLARNVVWSITKY